MLFRKTAAILSAAAIMLGTSAGTLPAAAYETKVGSCIYGYISIRSDAGSYNAEIDSMGYGDEAVIIGEKRDWWGDLWYEVQAGSTHGYVYNEYLSVAPTAAGTGFDSYDAGADFEAYLDSQGFPESYKPYLRELHRQHPSWVFNAQHLGIDWDRAVAEECVIGRNLVHAEAPDSWKSMERGAYDYSTGTWYGLDGSWVAASEGIIKHYMDPRNFLTDSYIFMFEDLSYEPAYQTIEGVRTILDGTFMSGYYTCPDTGEVKSYAQTFMEAAELSGVSPYHLASRCRNEQGVYGAPQSLGTVRGWENYFNFFDVQAFATATMTAPEMGCRYAATYDPDYLLPWTNQYKSIIGGSIFLGTGYITKEQDTLYLQKFDMIDGGNGYFAHQYMTCVFGQANEAMSLINAYSDDILATAMAFKIPVYDNMPEQLCPKPDSVFDNNDHLESLSIKGVQMDQSFNRYTTRYTASVPASVDKIEIVAWSESYEASVLGYGVHSLEEGVNTIKVVCTSPAGTVRTYTVEVTRGKAEQGMPYDIDNDGLVSVVDALLILNHTAGTGSLTGESLKKADVNGDGRADVVDALIILEAVSNS
ncbi:MAG: cadherin-like beta sandwich domain-containing protein [Ruminococcus sp.]|nr:cadherin-like beta sandwich domain-containing protein [Ruminococcus sp.]